MQLESLLQYVDAYLDVPGHPDSPNAMNGLQVEGTRDVRRVVAAVDASEASIREAIAGEADLLLVHHGIFWEGLQPLTGRLLRRVKPLLEHGVALYSVHLPLDSHYEVGNCALLARAVGLDLQGRFGVYEAAEIGWWGSYDSPVTAQGLQANLAEALDGSDVHLIPGGPDRVERVGVVTGSGASFVREAVDRGLDALVTGEGSHHAHFDAMELGIHLLLGGHYATEVFGVRALAEHIAERFGLEWSFVHQPTGL